MGDLLVIALLTSPFWAGFIFVQAFIWIYGLQEADAGEYSSAERYANDSPEIAAKVREFMAVNGRLARWQYHKILEMYIKAEEPELLKRREEIKRRLRGAA